MSEGEAPQPPAAPAPRRRRPLRRLAFALVPLLLLLALAEVAARLALPAGEERRYDPDPWREYVFIPGQEYEATGYWGTIHARINSLGHRGPELAAEEPPAGLRVACLGGSQAFGFGSSRDETSWPGALQIGLQRARPGRRVEVLNGGVPGWNVRTALTDWQLQLRQRGFDLLIVCEAYNDLQETASARYQAASRASGPDDLLRRRTLLERLLGGSEAWRWLLRELTEKRIKHMKLPGPVPAGEEAYAANLRAVVASARADGAGVLLCTYPHLFARSEAELRGLLGDKRVEATLRRCPFTYPGVQEGLRRYNERVREVARAEGVALCDLEARIPGQAALWVDPIHLSDQGAQAVADAVLEAALPLVGE